MSNYNMNLFNIEVEGIDMQDYPKFCDAYIGMQKTLMELLLLNKSQMQLTKIQLSYTKKFGIIYIKSENNG